MNLVVCYVADGQWGNTVCSQNCARSSCSVASLNCMAWCIAAGHQLVSCMYNTLLDLSHQLALAQHTWAWLPCGPCWYLLTVTVTRDMAVQPSRVTCYKRALQAAAAGSSAGAPDIPIATQFAKSRQHDVILGTVPDSNQARQRLLPVRHYQQLSLTVERTPVAAAASAACVQHILIAATKMLLHLVQLVLRHNSEWWFRRRWRGSGRQPAAA